MHKLIWNNFFKTAYATTGGVFMDYLKIFLSSLFSIIALFLSTKIIGNKQMSQLNMFDYINGITIGSIAADMAIHLDNNIFYPIIAIFVYTIVIALISKVGSKNIKLRRFLTGTSIILMDRGKLYYSNFKTAKLDLNEFLTQCRINGYYDLNDIETAILEQNGMLSFLPRSVSRPVTPMDLSLTPNIERPFFTVISDGKILDKNLEQSGLSINELHLQLKALKLEINDVFAGFYDGKKLSVYPRYTDSFKNDISQ